MGWEEWPLTLFTVTAQTAMGAFCWCFVALTAGKVEPGPRRSLERMMIVIWALVGLAFAFSAFHLGSPWRAINASFRFGRSAMSNEVVFGSAFVVSGLIGWAMCSRDLGSSGQRRFVLWLTLGCCLAFLAAMTSFYLMPTVPTWRTPLTPMAFVITAIIGGGAVAAMLFEAAGLRHHAWLGTGPVKLAAIAAVAAVLVTIAQSDSLAGIQSSIRQAAALTPDYTMLMGARFVIAFATLGLWARRVHRGDVLTLQAGVGYVLMLMVAEAIGRGIFYNLHMTVGLR